MIDTQQQYIKLNIRGEISIIVVHIYMVQCPIHCNRKVVLHHQGPYETWGYFCMNTFISTTRNCHSHIHESTHFILLDLLKVHVYPLFFSSFALDLSVVLQATKYFLLLHAYTLQVVKCVCGVMDNVPASSAVVRGFEHRSGQTKEYKIGMCCFSAKHAALRRKSKDWLVRNQDNVSEWGDMTVVSVS